MGEASGDLSESLCICFVKINTTQVHIQIQIQKQIQIKITNTNTSRYCYSYDCIAGCPPATVQERRLEGMQYPGGLSQEEQVVQLSSGQEVEY